MFVTSNWQVSEVQIHRSAHPVFARCTYSNVLHKCVSFVRHVCHIRTVHVKLLLKACTVMRPATVSETRVSSHVTHIPRCLLGGNLIFKSCSRPWRKWKGSGGCTISPSSWTEKASMSRYGLSRVWRTSLFNGRRPTEDYADVLVKILPECCIWLIPSGKHMLFLRVKIQVRPIHTPSSPLP